MLATQMTEVSPNSFKSWVQALEFSFSEVQSHSAIYGLGSPEELTY